MTTVITIHGALALIGLALMVLSVVLIDVMRSAGDCDPSFGL